MIMSVFFLLACQPVIKKAAKATAAETAATAEEADIVQETGDLDELDQLLKETDDDLGLDELEGIEME